MARLIGGNERNVQKGAPLNRWPSMERLEEELMAGDVDADVDEQRQQESRRKLLLKKRWHKLVDELLDDEMTGKAKRADKWAGKGEKGQAIGRSKKKWLSPSVGVEGGEKMVLIMKKPLDSDPQEEANSVPQMQTNTNQGTLQFERNSLPLASRPEATSGHQRRVLDDEFGVRRESLFTTNNHLGLKGAPKFGSDEEY